MAIDGESATRDEQRAIKEVCRLIKNTRRIEYYSLFKLMGLDVAIGYESTLARGGADPLKVYHIYQWIIVHELEVGADAFPNLFTLTMKTGWQGFVESRGKYKHLFTTPHITDDLNLHEISAKNPISLIRIKLGQEFTFELQSQIAGSVIALDFYEGDYYPIPLRHDGSFEPVIIGKGTHGFPQNFNANSIVPSRQRSHVGEHGHCFIVGPSDLMHFYSRAFRAGVALSLSRLDEMAERLKQVDEAKLAIYLENVLFE